MGRRIQRFKDWIALTTIFCFVVGLLLLSPVYFVMGLSFLGIIALIIVAVINDWKSTVFKSEDRLRISYRKQNNK